MQKEIDFERDPSMRDQDVQGAERNESKGEGDRESKGLEDLIQKASAGVSFGSGSTLSFDKKPVIKTSEIKVVHKKVKPLDVLLSSVIAILAATIVLLLLRNH